MRAGSTIEVCAARALRPTYTPPQEMVRPATSNDWPGETHSKVHTGIPAIAPSIVTPQVVADTCDTDPHVPQGVWSAEDHSIATVLPSALAQELQRRSDVALA